MALARAASGHIRCGCRSEETESQHHHARLLRSGWAASGWTCVAGMADTDGRTDRGRGGVPDDLAFTMIARRRFLVMASAASFPLARRGSGVRPRPRSRGYPRPDRRCGVARGRVELAAGHGREWQHRVDGGQRRCASRRAGVVKSIDVLLRGSAAACRALHVRSACRCAALVLVPVGHVADRDRGGEAADGSSGATTWTLS